MVAILVAFGSAPARADQGTYRARTFSESTSPGLAVAAPLQAFHAVARVRVVTPAEWRFLGPKDGTLRFLTPRVRACRYRIVFTARSVVAPRQDPAARAAAELPSPEARRLLESGTRDASAFRVVHEIGTAERVRLKALRVAVLTARPDIAAGGQVAWTDVTVTATSGTGDECHAGSWRSRVGPQIGDALATARTDLRFVRAT